MSRNSEDLDALMKTPEDLSAREFMQILLEMLLKQEEEGSAACFSSTAADPTNGTIYSIDWAVHLVDIRVLSSGVSGSRVN